MLSGVDGRVGKRHEMQGKKRTPGGQDMENEGPRRRRRRVSGRWPRNGSYLAGGTMVVGGMGRRVQNVEVDSKSRIARRLMEWLP